MRKRLVVVPFESTGLEFVIVPVGDLGRMLSLSPLVDPVREALNTQVRHFSILSGWANILVALGVAGEGVEFVHDAIAWIKRRQLKKSERAIQKELLDIFPADEANLKEESHADHPRWVKRLTRIGLIVVVIGVTGEWRYGNKLEDAHNAVMNTT
jgi:hypothetical protein